MKKLETEKFIEHLLKVAVAHTMGAEAENGKLSPTMKVFDYTANGKTKSLYIDWRSREQMRKGVFSYSQDFVKSAKEQYEMIVIANAENPYDNLRWFPSQTADFAVSYIEDDAEPVYTIDYSKKHNYSKRYEKENE